MGDTYRQSSAHGDTEKNQKGLELLWSGNNDAYYADVLRQLLYIPWRSGARLVFDDGS